MTDAPSPPTWHSEVSKDRTAREDLLFEAKTDGKDRRALHRLQRNLFDSHFGKFEVFGTLTTTFYNPALFRWVTGGMGFDPCDEWPVTMLRQSGGQIAEVLERPAVPHGEDCVWYRGWECGWDQQREYWTGSGYVACKGGFDRDAPCVDAGTWAALLDEVDEQEDE